MKNTVPTVPTVDSGDRFGVAFAHVDTSIATGTNDGSGGGGGSGGGSGGAAAANTTTSTSDGVAAGTLNNGNAPMPFEVYRAICTVAVTI